MKPISIPPDSDMRKFTVIAPSVVGVRYMVVAVQVSPVIKPPMTSGEMIGTLHAT